MTAVRTIRKKPLLMQIMKAAGGIHARTALEQARAALASTRGDNILAIAAALADISAWRALMTPDAEDWVRLYEASSNIISLSDPDDDIHLVRAARLLCEYVDRTPVSLRSAAIGVLFINTLKAMASQEVDEAARAEVMRQLEQLIDR